MHTDPRLLRSSGIRRLASRGVLTLTAIFLGVPLSALALQITNVTRSLILFQEDFEASRTGAAPAEADPLVGSWSFNGQALASVVSAQPTGLTAAQGTHCLQLFRQDWPILLARASAGSVAASQPGDTLRLSLALRVDRGVASIYPTAAQTDLAQISFFSNGRVSMVDPAGTSHQFLSQTLRVSNWNVVILEFRNGGAEWKISINDAPFEARLSGSSMDGHSGGLLAGCRLQTDAPDTLAYFDAIPGSTRPPHLLSCTQIHGQLELRSTLPGFALEENQAPHDSASWWSCPNGSALPTTVALTGTQNFFRLRKVLPPPATLPKVIAITWRKGPDLPQGFQDSDGGIVGGQLVTVAGYCAGQTDIPGKQHTYPGGFLRRVWSLDLQHPAQGWWDLPSFPGAARQELFGLVVEDQWYGWGGFSYSYPFCYRDGYRLSRPQGAWRWDPLPSLPWPLSSAGICAIGSSIYVVGGADYDLNRFFTSTDRTQSVPKLGARLLVFDTVHPDRGWRELPSCPGTPRFVAAVAAVRGRLYLMGGATGDDNVTGHYATVVDNWCYDPATQQWLRLADTPIATGNFPSGAIVYRERYVLLIGGYQYANVLNPDGSARAPYGEVAKFYPTNLYNSDVLVFDVKHGTFGRADSLPLCNNLPMAVLAGDTLHLIGGETGGSVIEGEPFGHHPDLYLVGQLQELP